VAGLGDKVNLSSLSWAAFLLNNLLPVTIGNIIGGSLFVGIVYWMIYLQKTKETA
jgi:formate/nitrite transporter FocA (FNT family)